METVIRVVVIYLFLLFAMRLLGKREFGQLSPHEFIVLLIIPEMVSTSLNKNDKSLTNGLVGVTTIFMLVVLTSILSHRFKKVEDVVSDTAMVLVHNGRVFEHTLNKERVTPEEILSEARKSGVDSLDEIRWAIIEADGTISIVPMEEGGGNNRPPKDPGN